MLEDYVFCAFIPECMSVWDLLFNLLVIYLEITRFILMYKCIVNI